MQSPGEQVAICFYPPAYDIRVERIPIPRIEYPDDAIVKVKLAGLCGSDLHIYRGTEGIMEPCVCGHEFVGEVIALGSSFHPNASGRPSLYSTLQVGDKVISPFTVSCGECNFCHVGFTARCVESCLFGSPHTPGGQAQYVRVPKAGGTLYNLQEVSAVHEGTKPDVKEFIPGLADSSLLLLCDILPTGVFAAFQALNHPKVLPMMRSLPFPHSSACTAGESIYSAMPLLRPGAANLTIAIIGLGPVGVCTCIAAIDFLHANGSDFKIVAIDPVETRRNKVTAIYSKISCDQTRGFLEVADINESKRLVSEWTNGIGCNVVFEVVGNNSALMLAYELVRPFGCITSVGVHANSNVPFTGQKLYNKNVSLDFGRCPVRAMFPMALDLLLRRQDVFSEVGGEVSLIDKIVGFDVAGKTYEEFDRRECGKVLFDPWR
ncbi:chaperonin 10-like protein [Scleroderma citrinum]